MQEMDLEELDQEVNKLMDQAGKGRVAKKADDSTAKPADTSVPVTTIKTDDKPTADNSGPVVVRRATQILPRKNGIAMDIVQPKSSSIEPPSVKAARVAPTLQPAKQVAPEEPAKTEDKPVEEAPKIDEPPKDVSDDTLASLDMQIDGKPKADMLNDPDHDAHKSVWPDPLDVHGFKADDDKKPIEEPAKEEAKPEEQKSMEHTGVAINPLSDEAKADEGKPEDKPAEDAPSSPFVDTKVEKRPLGAYADAKTEEPKEEAKEEEPKTDDKSTDDAEAKTDEDKDDSKTDPASMAIQTPKELSPEVVAVESSEPEFIPGAPALEGDETDMNNLRQMAIPQQYEGKDKKPSDKDRPIFDTKDYHPALKPTPAAHKSSKAGTVVTIILILLMIAAAAVAYFTITGTLDITKLL